MNQNYARNVNLKKYMAPKSATDFSFYTSVADL